MQAISKKSFEIFETLSTPRETKGIQDDQGRKLDFLTEDDYKAELARRASDLPKDNNYNFCIVFPTKVASLGSFTKCQGRFVEIKQKTQIELEDERHAILRAIKEAGFQVQLVYSSTREQIICKIGSNDGRLLKEAENKEHKFELNSKAVKHVLELKVKETFPDAKVSRPKHPVFLDFRNYSEEEFEKIQHLGGPETLPLYLKRDFDKYDPESSKVDIETARSTFLAQSRGNPFHHLHIKYDSDWEEKIIREHKVQLYRGYNDGSILRNADRIILTLSALQSNTVTINGVKGAGLNLKKLQFQKQILAYYPIQSVQQAQDAGDLTGDELYERFLWSSSWFPKRIFLAWRQPIQDIRDYCGEKIAYYFAFLEFYSLWLVPSALAGLIVFGLQLRQLSLQAGTYDIVTQAVKIVPLVLRNESGITDLSNVTDEQVEELVRNHPFTTERTPFVRSIDGEIVLFNIVPTEIPLVIPLYALGISIWAAFFLEFWKRHQSALAYRWGVSEYERQAEVRPEFKSEYDVPDAVTGLPTPYRSKLVFGLKLGLSFSIVFSAVLITVAAFAATYIFKAFMSQSELLDPTVATQIALVLNSVAIMILATVFRSAAATLTSWENHRTDIEYEDHLIAKTFVFSFFNSYTTLLYFAFFRKDSRLPPNDQVQFCVAELSERDIDFVSNKSDSGLFLSEDLVKIDTCYGALGYSLMIIFVTQILISNSIEIGTPLISRFMNNYSTGKSLRNRAERLRQQGHGLVHMTVLSRTKGEDGYHDVAEEKSPDPEIFELVPQGLPLKSLAEQQFLLQPYHTPFDDYLELALQFGYVTLFVAAFPLAPTLALLNNCLEVWVDSKKVCTLSRRPNLPRAQDIGTWLYIFTILSYLAIIINSAVLLFTSIEIVPLDLDREDIRVWAFLAFILSVFFVKYFADFFVSDVPTWVTVQIDRQNYIEQKIFYDDEEGTGRLFAQRENTGKDGVGQLSSEELVEKKAQDFKQFKILEQDPYLEEMIQRMKKNLIEKGMTEDKLFNMIDVNHNEVITLKELKKLLLRKDIGLGDKMSKAELQIVVDALDVDDDGKISRDDLRSFLNETHVATTDVETTL